MLPSILIRLADVGPFVAKTISLSVCAIHVSNLLNMLVMVMMFVWSLCDLVHIDGNTSLLEQAEEDGAHYGKGDQAVREDGHREVGDERAHEKLRVGTRDLGEVPVFNVEIAPPVVSVSVA